MVRTYVGLGANVGDAQATLEGAVAALAALPGVRLRGVSRVYATRPVGVADQPEFRNAVVALDAPAGTDPAIGALALLAALKSIERAFGRQEGERWGPRELDLDLLIFGRHRLHLERPSSSASLRPAARGAAGSRRSAGLQPSLAASRSVDPARTGVQWLDVPHASARERLFVLEPLADLAPRLVPPGWPETVETARRRQAALEGAGAVRPVGEWLAGARGWR